MTKTELKKVFDLDKKIGCMLEKLTRLEHDVCTIRGMDFGSGVRSSTPSSFDGLVAKICDLQVKINKEIDRLIDLKLKVKSIIDKLDGVYYVVMSKRYLQGKLWIDIASEMHYSQGHVLRLHGEALNRIEKLNK